MTTDPEPHPKPWTCDECGHIIGLVVRVQRNGSHLSRLELCSGTIRVEGWASVDCPMCGDTREWFPGQAEIDALVDRTKQ